MHSFHNRFVFADYAFIGENDRDWSGYSVSSAGDVDGDGLDDILIGAIYNDDGGNPQENPILDIGFQIFGNSLHDRLIKRRLCFIGENDNDNVGLVISGAGDVDGDGLDDIPIGSPYNDDGGSQAGKSYLTLFRLLAKAHNRFVFC